MDQQGLAIRPTDIDLNLLRVLLALLEARSVTGAARKLGISQPAASRLLAQLRTTFQDPLLIRTNHGMEPTRRAEELIEPLRDWLAATTALFTAKNFDPGTLDRPFRIAATDFGVFAILPALLRAFSRQAPNASIDILPFDDRMIGRLGSGALDLVITGEKPDFSTIYGCHLFSGRRSCVMRAGHPAWTANGQPLPLERFLDWPHIDVTPDGVPLAPEHGARQRIVATLPYYQAVPHLLPGSDAIAILADSLARTYAGDPRLAIMPAPPELAAFDYWALWHERSRRDPATLWVIDLLVAAGADMTG